MLNKYINNDKVIYTTETRYEAEFKQLGFAPYKSVEKKDKATESKTIGKPIEKKKTNK